jgi:hypothetical protein
MSEEFLKELKELVNKHNVSFKEIEEYSGDDDHYTGTEIYLVFGEIADYSNTLREYLEKLGLII